MVKITNSEAIIINISKYQDIELEEQENDNKDISNRTSHEDIQDDPSIEKRTGNIWINNFNNEVEITTEEQAERGNLLLIGNVLM